jgi:hypothetical protein
MHRRTVATIGGIVPSRSRGACRMTNLTPAEARAIAKEAWLYSFAPVSLYGTMHAQAIDTAAPSYVGGFNRFRHYDRLATPADTDIVTPNNDTPYSWAWLDLRAEPVVLSVPAVAERYYVNQWFDLYTHNFAYTGVRATGRAAGNYLFAGPGWDGTVPDGIDGVFRSETAFIGTLTRTGVDGADDIPAMKAVQTGYRLTSLSAFAGTPAPSGAPAVDWPADDKDALMGLGFIPILNALLRFMPTVPSEAEMFARFARIGIGAGRVFDASALDPAVRDALMAGVAEAAEEFQAKTKLEKTSMAMFGSRAQLGPDYIYQRAAGAALGILGNTKDEAVYASQQTGPDGNLLDGRVNRVLRFAPGQLPPVNLFWSITMYGLPARLLVPNPIDRYSIGDRTPGLKRDADGGLTIYLQAENPGPDKASNWLPTPKGPFFFAGRFYGPKPEALDGRWTLPLLEIAG